MPPASRCHPARAERGAARGRHTRLLHLPRRRDRQPVRRLVARAGSAHGTTAAQGDHATLVAADGAHHGHPVRWLAVPHPAAADVPSGLNRRMRRLAVLDVGKTNVKLAVLDQRGGVPIACSMCHPILITMSMASGAGCWPNLAKPPAAILSMRSSRRLMAPAPRW